MCPRLPVKPANCVCDEPDMWRDGDTEAGTVCPLLLVPEFDYEFKAYNMLSHNQSPNACGWENESYRWNQAIEIIGSVTAQVQRSKLEEMKQNK
ncbi:MAG: hypothetical protein COA54_02525 [Thiotrichaceae bacterium]|nr:MAG: hypothetical protein COA54_02525 [Thiotrichaceae bacterium]